MVRRVILAIFLYVYVSWLSMLTMDVAYTHIPRFLVELWRWWAML
jgi:hypothetical protein